MIHIPALYVGIKIAEKDQFIYWHEMDRQFKINRYIDSPNTVCHFILSVLGLFDIYISCRKNQVGKDGTIPPTVMTTIMLAQTPILRRL